MDNVEYTVVIMYVEIETKLSTIAEDRGQTSEASGAIPVTANGMAP